MSHAQKDLPKARDHLLGGGLSGLVSCLLLQPIDRLKTLVQQQRRETDTGRHAEQALAGRSRMARVTRTILREEGVKGLWKGTFPTIYRNVPGVALYFLSMSELRQMMARFPIWQAASGGGPAASAMPKLSGAGNLVAGGLARSSVGFIMMPITVVKVRYESNLYQYNSIASALTQIMRQEGLPGLFRGFAPTLWRDAPYAGLYLLFYEKVKAKLSSYSSGSVSSPMAINAASGCFAGAFATSITNPIDVVKTRTQIQPLEYPTIVGSIRRIWRQDGAQGFLDGIGLRLTRKVLSSAIGWAIYEEIIRR